MYPYCFCFIPDGCKIFIFKCSVLWICYIFPVCLYSCKISTNTNIRWRGEFVTYLNFCQVFEQDYHQCRIKWLWCRIIWNCNARTEYISISFIAFDIKIPIKTLNDFFVKVYFHLFLTWLIALDLLVACLYPRSHHLSSLRHRHDIFLDFRS